MKRVAGNLLLAFVLVSIGFALGQEWTLRSASPVLDAAASAVHPATAPATIPAAERKVVVSYLHANIRCITCNTIEKTADQVVKGRFADLIAAGKVEWRTVNFQKDEELARRYDVSSATVVVSKMQGGREVGFRRLDDVWTLVRQPEKFEDYISAAIRAALEDESR